MPKDPKEIHIHQFKGTSIIFIKNNKLKMMYFNYRDKVFDVTDTSRIYDISFDNYSDIFKAVRLYSNGEIKIN